MAASGTDPSGGAGGPPSRDGLPHAFGARLARGVAAYRKLPWVVVLDQFVSSANSFFVVLLFARLSDQAAFGAFSLCYAVFTFVFLSSRSLVGEVLLVRRGESSSQHDDRSALGAATLVGLLGGLAMLAGGMLSDHMTLWVTFAVASPIILLQDTSRMVLIKRKRAVRLFMSDAAWFVVSAALLLTSAFVSIPATAALALWCTGGGLALCISLQFRSGLPKVDGALDWFKHNRRFSAQFFSESLALGFSNVLVWYVLAFVLGVAGVGALRGAQLLFAPLNTVMNAIRVAVIPELVAAVGRPSYRRRRRVLLLMLLMCTGIWAVLVLACPDSLGEELLGRTWASAEDLRLPTAVQYLCFAAYVALLVHFRAAWETRASAVMRSVLAIGTVVLPFIAALGTHRLGAAAWGLAAATGIAVCVGSVVGSRPARANRSA